MSNCSRDFDVILNFLGKTEDDFVDGRCSFLTSLTHALRLISLGYVSTSFKDSAVSTTSRILGELQRLDGKDGLKISVSGKLYSKPARLFLNNVVTNKSVPAEYHHIWNRAKTHFLQTKE